jgi:hypothetical protein
MLVMLRRSDTRLLEILKEGFARLIQKADWIYEVEKSTADLRPISKIKVLEQLMQQTVVEFRCRPGSDIDDEDGPQRSVR